MDSHDFAYHDPIPVWAPNRPNTPTSNFSSHSDDMTTDMASHDFEDDDPIPVLAKTVANTPIEDIASSSNSAEKVFAITELAEMICLKLDDDDTTPTSRISTAIVDLFNLLRVSRTFKAAIESSKKLQRVMLLSYDGKDAPERPFGLEFLLNGPLGHERFHPALPCGIEHPGLGGVRVAITAVIAMVSGATGPLRP
ncbi:hypothetical protein PRZ48_006958 [Zasmidium cellare]|uniref:Uncharacterized protein n=1 Tax=Zasmidium cellare TaxID=395010 RepID=A0ABR0EI10_ZASCE|nr:hypothetical protein PRZ48_006958 [Zasmidium cellare]